MEKLCNVLSEIHLRSVVTFSVSTPTTAEYLSTSIGLRNYRISIGCWFKVFPCTFPVCRRIEGWECNFSPRSTHKKLAFSCINYWCKVASFRNSKREVKHVKWIVGKRRENCAKHRNDLKHHVREWFMQLLNNKKKENKIFIDREGKVFRRNM